MLKLTFNDKIYKVKYGYNAFCDTDLMDRVKSLMDVASHGDEENTDGLAMTKDLFKIVRELLFKGLEKNHKDEITSLEMVGDLLDDFCEETGNGILELFNMIINELFSEGFLKGFLDGEVETDNPLPKEPQDHKKKTSSSKKSEPKE